MIRQGKKEDLKAISRILYEVHNIHYKNRPDIFKNLNDPIDMSYYHKFLYNKDHRLFVIEVENTIVGYMTLIISRICDHPVYQNNVTLKVEDLGILNNYKKQGFGSKLFNKAILTAKSINADKIELQVWDFNTIAKNFYNKKQMKNKTYNLELILSDHIKQ